MSGVTSFLLMWLFGNFLFYALIMLCREKFGYHIDSHQAVFISFPASLIWAIVGAVLTNKDEKIAAGRKDISNAVAKLFNKD